MENEHQSQSDSIGNSLSHKFNALVGKDYVWPDWNESLLGRPPKISIPTFQSHEDIAEFNNVLSHISKMADADASNKLIDQLKKLSGTSINIKDFEGNQNAADGPIGGPYVRAKNGHIGNEPEVSFNPNAWGKYPVEGNNTKYAIATPEQMMIHELGHYLEIQNIADALKSANEKSNIPISAGATEQKAYLHAQDEQYIVNSYENPVMSSLDATFEKRDATRYQDAVILIADKNGYPKGLEQDRAALIHSMQTSKRVIPEELRSFNQTLRIDSDYINFLNINALAANKLLDLHFEHLASIGTSASNLQALKTLTNNITELNSINQTLPDITLVSNVTNDREYSA